jgi:hypothetical protein
MTTSPPLRMGQAIELRTAVALILAVFAPAALAQAPWVVTVNPTMNPLPVGFCAAVQVSIRDASGAEAPRNPQGYRVTLADFDMSVTSSNSTSVVGQQIDASHWSVCACQGAEPGASATITASYPARALPESARVKGASFQSTARFELAAPKGTTNPPACKTPEIPAASAMPAPASQPARVAVGSMPASPPMTVVPAAAPTRSDPVGRVEPNGAIGERVAPYKPGPVTFDLDLGANGSWVMVPGPATFSLDLDARGTWYEPGPMTFTLDLSATGTWIEIAKPTGEIKEGKQ